MPFELICSETFRFFECVRENENTQRLASAKNRETVYFLVNNVNFSPLYNTGICSWHSLKRTVRPKKTEVTFVFVLSGGNNCKFVFFFFALFISKKKPLRSTVQKSNIKKKKKFFFLEEETKKKLNKKAPKATTNRTQPNNRKNYTDMQLTLTYTELYRHAKTTLP